MAQYRMRCNHCGHTYVTSYKSASCPRHDYRGHSSTFVEDVLETAVDVAAAYFAVDLAMDVASGVGDLLGSLFD
jgi:hypothetical protein